MRQQEFLFDRVEVVYQILRGGHKPRCIADVLFTLMLPPKLCEHHVQFILRQETRQVWQTLHEANVDELHA